MPNRNKPASICIACENDSKKEEVFSFATRSGYPMCPTTGTECELQLRFGTDRVSLYDSVLDTDIHIDFISGALAHRKKYGGGKGQAIAKAVGLNKFDRPKIIDATAGLARDAYVLASLGCRMTLIEESPILHILIEDGIRRAQLSDETEHAVNNIVDVINANSEHYLDALPTESRPDVIYIDPMYPERKKSALVKKDMQILHKLVGKERDNEELLAIALKTARRRVVVKRPSQAASITGRQPTMSINSKKTRYDVYVIG